MNLDDTSINDMIDAVVERLLPVLVENGQRHYQQRLDAGRGVGRAKRDATEYLARLVREVSKDVQNQLQDRAVIPFAYPGIGWDADEYLLPGWSDPDYPADRHIRDGLRDMNARYQGEAEDVFAIPPILQPERVRLFVSGLSYREIGKQLGVNASVVEQSVRRDWITLIHIGRPSVIDWTHYSDGDQPMVSQSPNVSQDTD